MDRINNAFNHISRSNFVPDNQKSRAGIDVPLPIGHGQTISQPYTVRRMLEWLDARGGDFVLDVGYGSGWSSALLANLVGPKGLVYAVEKIPELMVFGKRNVLRLGINNVRFFISKEDVYGLPERAPFNRILVSASAQNLPKELINQLAIGGKMVIPVKNNILEITKKTDDKIETIVHPGFIFVPLL